MGESPEGILSLVQLPCCFALPWLLLFVFFYTTPHLVPRDAVVLNSVCTWAVWIFRSQEMWAPHWHFMSFPFPGLIDEEGTVTYSRRVRQCFKYKVISQLANTLSHPFTRLRSQPSRLPILSRGWGKHRELDNSHLFGFINFEGGWDQSMWLATERTNHGPTAGVTGQWIDAKEWWVEPSQGPALPSKHSQEVELPLSHAHFLVP